MKTAAFGIQKPRRTFAKQVLSQSRRVTNAVAVTSEVSANERVKIAQEAGEANSFRVAEVDSAEPQDFNPATVTAVIDVAKDWRQITLDVEISREVRFKLWPGIVTWSGTCEDRIPSVATIACFQTQDNQQFVTQLEFMQSVLLTSTAVHSSRQGLHKAWSVLSSEVTYRRHHKSECLQPTIPQPGKLGCAVQAQGGYSSRSHQGTPICAVSAWSR